MITVYWNALRVGDTVTLHDLGDPCGPLLDGTVAMVDATQTQHGVGVRVHGEEANPKLVWPSRLRVHIAPHDRSDPCRWCPPYPHQVTELTPR